MMNSQYNNPIVLERADPWVYKHTDGYYYFTGSVPGYQKIELRRAKNLNELKKAKAESVWFAHKSGPLSCLIWAPEIHYIDGKWYIYFAASDDENIRDEYRHHRIFAIENDSVNPLEGVWKEKGQIKTQFDSFSLDATEFEHAGKKYFVWAQLDPRIPGNSNLYIAEMANPWTLKTTPTLLSIPEFSWEKNGFKVNEGPAVIVRNNRVFITYSASATDENYCMGLLWADADKNLLNGFNWHKAKNPVFKTSSRNHRFGPGHNCFTVAEDNKTDVLVYHARPSENKSGDPLDNPDRHACAQTFSWTEDGFPMFGEPK